MRRGVWDERDLEVALSERRDRHRDAVERDETLLDDVPRPQRVEREAEPLAVTAQHTRRAIDVALDEVNAERDLRRRRALQIHPCPRLQSRQGRATAGLFDDVALEAPVLARYDREARAADVHAVVDAESFGQGGRDPKP